MTTKPIKKPAKKAKLSVNMRKGKTLSMKGSDFTIMKLVDKTSPM
jgi:hypothetical protein